VPLKALGSSIAPLGFLIKFVKGTKGSIYDPDTPAIHKLEKSFIIAARY